MTALTVEDVADLLAEAGYKKASAHVRGMGVSGALGPQRGVPEPGAPPTALNLPITNPEDYLASKLENGQLLTFEELRGMTMGQMGRLRERFPEQIAASVAALRK